MSKVTVSELFSLLERIVEHEGNAMRIYVYNVDETALTTLKKKRKVIIKKCNIAYLVNLKCEERNHYKSSTLLVATHLLW